MPIERILIAGRLKKKNKKNREKKVTKKKERKKWEIALRTKTVALEQKELKTLNKALNNEWHNRMHCTNPKAAI